MLEVIIKRAEIEFFPWVMESLTIENAEQMKNASDMLALGKKLYSSLEDSRKAEKQPIMEKAKAVDEQYKPALNRVQMAVGRLDDALIVYHRKLKAEADALIAMQAAEMKAKQQAAEALQIQQMMENAAKAEESKQTGEVFDPVEITPMPEPEAIIVEPVKQTVRGNMGTTSIKETPDFLIIDEDAVPRDLCMPDMKKIKARYASGVKSIPGVLITMKQHTISRFS